MYMSARPNRVGLGRADMYIKEFFMIPHWYVYFTKVSKMLFQGFYGPGSDPPHKIMRYWFYSSTSLVR